MSEDVARAVGAGIPGELKIKGKSYALRPLTVKELTELQRTCLKRYQRKYMETFKENIDLLSDNTERQHELLSKELQKVGRWGLDDLPLKEVFDSSRVKITDELKAWLKENIGATEAVLKSDKKTLQLVATALDGGVLTIDTCFQLTGTAPQKVKTGYVNWWVTGSSEGMVHFVWLSIRGSGLTEEELETEISDKYENIVTAARDIENLTVPAMGNG